MKKTLLTCMAVLALFAIAGTAGAITCTVDQRPAATLLVPWFQVMFNADGTVTGGATALDTIVTIGNASSAPMIAHVNVFSERSTLALDFNVALTGFDVQSMRMQDVLSGILPSTPHTSAGVPVSTDVCQRVSTTVYPSSGGFIRVIPAVPADPNDNTLATALYTVPAFTVGGAFQLAVLAALGSPPVGTSSLNIAGCAGTAVVAGIKHGYITIDHANYCNLSNPQDANYYLNDALGNENNLYGEVIYTSGSGIPTYGASTVNIESDREFSDVTDDAGGLWAGGGTWNATQQVANRNRTFYARFWSPTTETSCTNCAACTGANPTAADVGKLNCRAPWDTGFGDEREPLGLKYAARYFDSSSAGIASNWIVWRAGGNAALDTDSVARLNLLGSTCTLTEVTPSLVFYDEDENPVTVSSVPLPSPLPPPGSAVNIPLETQRGTLVPRPFAVGWVSVEFRNLTAGNGGSVLDQAWMSYEFAGAAQFYNSAQPATQLDPSTCNPLGVPIAAVAGTACATPFCAQLIAPAIPGGVLGTNGGQTQSVIGSGPAQ